MKETSYTPLYIGLACLIPLGGVSMFLSAQESQIRPKPESELVVHPDLHRRIYHLQVVLVISEDGKLFAKCGACGYNMPILMDWETNIQATVKDIKNRNK